MKNPHPTKRARRIEMRRKELGADRCFYCPESEIACLELDHPVGEKRDREFKVVDCRNCHRKIEFDRDVAKLTKNGQHIQRESKNERFRRYLLLMALFFESIAKVLESPHASHELVAQALRAAAASFRRKAKEVPDINFSRTRGRKKQKQRRNRRSK